MIKVHELRIGNYITDDDGCIAKINGFNPFDHSIRCDEAEGCILLIDVYHELTGKWKMGREADSPECNAIPLTPEWLEKLGFTIPDDFGFVMRVYRGVVRIKIDERLRLPTVKIGEMHFTNILNVHQLQNVYLDLTGEALTINHEHLQIPS